MSDTATSDSGTTATADIGVVGMAVMGSNLARNLAHHGHATAVYNRTAAKTDQLIAEHGDEGEFVPSHDIDAFVASLKKPRAAIIMVQAGAARMRSSTSSRSGSSRATSSSTAATPSSPTPSAGRRRCASGS